jgi:hypothetical protein
LSWAAEVRDRVQLHADAPPRWLEQSRVERDKRSVYRIRITEPEDMMTTRPVSSVEESFTPLTKMTYRLVTSSLPQACDGCQTAFRRCRNPETEVNHKDMERKEREWGTADAVQAHW